MRIRILNRLFPERKHRHNYNQFLSYLHRSFDVKGLTTQGTFTLDLEQVFVDLALAPQPRQQRASSDPMRPMPATLRQGRHGLWAYITNPQLKQRHLVILGPPGSGKTTLLKYVTLMLAADEKVKREKQVPLNLTPVLLFLRNQAPRIAQDPRFSLLDAVSERLQGVKHDVSPSWVTAEIKKGHALIMLDGLDEVADPVLRQQTVAWVERQMQQFGQNRFLVTSRPFGYYSNPLQNATQLEVRPFTIDQVEQFVHNWYLANEIMSAQRDDPGVRMEAERGGNDLLMRLRQVPVLLEMAVNPLLLTMIATVHRYRSSLPGRRVELYAEISEVFLGKRQQARGMTFDLTPSQKQRVLQVLAYYMMTHNMREIAVDEAALVIEEPLQRVKGPQQEASGVAGEAFLKEIENSSGLLIEREAAVYSFAHLTFQEYMASVHVLDQKLVNALVKWVDDSWWHETIRLYAAQTDATSIIKACLTQPKPSVPALTLAMECLEEAREVRPELRTIFQRLSQSVDHPSPQVRQIAAEVFLMLRLRRMLRIDEKKYVDAMPITHAEYQLFLDETRYQSQYHQPDHWKSYRYEVGNGRTPVAGVRPADAQAFCRWLTARETVGRWQYRLPTAEELAVSAPANGSHVENAAAVGVWFSKEGSFQCAMRDKPGAFASQLTHRFEYDWDLSMSMRRDAVFKQALQLILTRAEQRRYTLLDLDRDLPDVLSPEMQQDLWLVRDRATRDAATDLDEALTAAIGIVNNPNLERARDIDLQPALELAQMLDKDLETAPDQDLARGATQEIVRSVRYATEMAVNREVVMFQELDRALNNALRLTREVETAMQRSLVRARTRLRANLLAEATALLDERARRKASGVTRAGENSRRQLTFLIDLYLDMALLEERIAGNIPALEGFRIVKVRP